MSHEVEIEFELPVTAGALIEALEVFGPDRVVDISGMCGTRGLDITSLRFDGDRVRLVAD